MSLEIRRLIVKTILDKNIKTIAIAMHNSPDGDSIGSAIAFEKALSKIGKKVDVLIHNKISDHYAPIVGNHRVNKIFTPSHGKVYDLLFIVDCADPDRTVDNVKKIAKKKIRTEYPKLISTFSMS